MIKILIVEDHKRFAEILEKTINSIPNCEVIKVVDNGLDFMPAFKECLPDIVFMDIKLPGLDGIEATKQAFNENRHSKIICMTQFNEKEYFMKMMCAGAKGFLLKDSNKASILQAIKIVKSGGFYYPHELTKSILCNSANEQEIPDNVNRMNF